MRHFIIAAIGFNHEQETETYMNLPIVAKRIPSRERLMGLLEDMEVCVDQLVVLNVIEVTKEDWQSFVSDIESPGDYHNRDKFDGLI